MSFPELEFFAPSVRKEMNADIVGNYVHYKQQPDYKGRKIELSVNSFLRKIS